MTLWLSQPKGAQSGHEAKGWRSANRLVELRDATKLLGSAVDAMVFHGVPVAKTWTIGYKYGVFLGKSSKNGGLNGRISYFLEVLMGQSVTISYK